MKSDIGAMVCLQVVPRVTKFSSDYLFRFFGCEESTVSVKRSASKLFSVP